VSLTDSDGVAQQPTGQEYLAPWTGFDWLTPGTYTMHVTAEVPGDGRSVDVVVRDVLRSGADFGRIVIDPSWTEPSTVPAGTMVTIPATVMVGDLPVPEGRRLFGLGFLRLDEISNYAYPEVTLLPATEVIP
jgi:hypothetical protein